MKKITVSSIKAINSLTKNSQQLYRQLECTYLNIYEDYIITYETQRQNIFTVKKLSKGDIIFQQSITLPKIKKTAILENFIGIVCQMRSQFYVVDLRTGALSVCQGHMDTINEVIVFEGNFLTAGKDLTIRIWEVSHKKQQNFIKFPKALKGHKMPINTLTSFHQFLLSGSQDKSLIVWHKNKIWCQYTFSTSIIKIQPFALSSQIIVITKDFLAYFINMETIIKKSIKIRGTLNLQQLSNPIRLVQVDDSFGLVLQKQRLKFFEVNLIKNMHQIQFEQNGIYGQDKSKLNKLVNKEQNFNKITSLRYKGRCLFYGGIGLGVQVVKI